MNEAEDLKRLIQDVCVVFTEVTGAPASPQRDQRAIITYAKLGWKLFDFRLLITWEFKDESQKEYYGKPGNMNLRAMLNPARQERLIDVHSDLKVKDAIDKKKLEQYETPIRERKLLMRCGSKIHRTEYARHMDLCFEKKGACFY